MKKIILAGLLFLIVFSSGRSTSPTPPPPYTFIVEGSVQCDTISNRSLFTVVLYGRKNGRDSNLTLMRGLQFKDEQPIALTSQGGFFVLRVSDWEQLDTIRPAIISDGRVKFWGQAYPVDKTKIQPVYTYTTYSTEGYGCNSCNADEVTSASPYISKYEYYLYNVMINICN